MKFAKVVVTISAAMVLPMAAPVAYASGDGPDGSGEGGSVYCGSSIDKQPFADSLFDSDAVQASGTSCKSVGTDGGDGAA
jgi:hypothetical protein